MAVARPVEILASDEKVNALLSPFGDLLLPLRRLHFRHLGRLRCGGSLWCWRGSSLRGLSGRLLRRT